MLGLGVGLGFNRVIGVPFLLDKFSGAAAAYSLRALSSSTTDVVRVRRSSDNAEQDFSPSEIEDGTLEDWVNARDVAPADYGAGAAAAYSLRYVSDSYNGDVVRVRRSSDNAEADFTPSEITDGTLLSWVGNTASDNGYVTTWFDQAGNNDATQTTAANQPKIVDAGVLVEENGRPAMDFDGGSNLLDTGYIITGEFSIEGVVKANSTATTKIIMGNRDSANERAYISVNDSVLLDVISAGVKNINNNALVGTTQATNQTSIGLYVDSSEANLYGNGSLEDTESISAIVNNTTQSAYIGAFNGSGSPFNYFNGNIQEIIVYPSDQSSDRENIEANINDYYSIYTNTNDGFVTTWYDQAGSNDATQTTASNQPKIVDAGALVTENGKPAIEFDGTDQLSFTIGSPTSLSTFLVSKWDDLTTGVLTKGDSRTIGATRDFDIFGNGTTLNIYFEDTSNTVDLISLGAFTTSNYYLVSTFHESGSVPQAALDGSVVNGISSLGDLDADQSNFYVGGGSSSIYQFDGKIKEIIIYDSDQSSNRTGIETNINNHYSIY